MSTVIPEPSTLDWAKVDLNTCPSISVPPPGPKSNEYHQRCTRHFKGLSGQVKLFPVAFESGEGCVLTDVDGNRYIDFSSGIYVTTLGHCHPKISEAVANHARRLMNAHDFTTPVKMMLMEKLAEIMPGDISGFQQCDKSVGDLSETIYGNGRDGLKSTVQKQAGEITAIRTEIKRDRRWIGKIACFIGWFFATCCLAYQTFAR